MYEVQTIFESMQYQDLRTSLVGAVSNHSKSSLSKGILRDTSLILYIIKVEIEDQISI